MVEPDGLKKVDEGTGYFIGEMQGTHPHLKYLKEGAIVTLFDGVDNTLDFITTKMPKPNRGSSSVDRGRGEFNSFDTYEEAMETFRKHPEKIVKFDPAELRIKDDNEIGSRVDYDVVGDYIDMGRYMEGIPEVMGSMYNGNTRNRRMAVVVSLCQQWDVNHDIITHRSERILRLVDGLEAGGFRTQLTGIESSQCNHTEIILKQYADPLTITDLAIVTHPEFLRRAIFRIIEHSKTFSHGYGSAIVFGESLTPELIETGNNDEVDIVIDGNMRSIEQVDELFDQLERLLVWELSKPVPEVSSIKVDRSGIWFNPNGVRPEADVRREGQEAINAV